MPDIFTEQERPYLSRQKRKKDYTDLLLVLLFLFLVAFAVDVIFGFTEVRAETGDTIELSDYRIYEQYENETLEMCEKYIESRTH